MSKFKKKKGGELPAISTASLPDIVFMLLFFFMVATVMRDNNVMVGQELPAGDQVEKLKKDRSMFIYAGKPGESYGLGSAERVQINDKFVGLEEIKPSVYNAIEGLTPELQDKLMVALKVDSETKMGLMADVKMKLREANALKIMYITNKQAPGQE
jgi:biopolymer transport protein ExbD